MSELVQFLCKGDHPIEARLREKTRQALKESIASGHVRIKFTDTRGGTELGVRPPAHAAAMADVAAVNLRPSRDTHHRPPKIPVGIGAALCDNRCRPIVVVRSIWRI